MTSRRTLPGVFAATLTAILLFAAAGPASARESGHQPKARGLPAPAYPSAKAIAAAVRFLDTRAGRTSFAVVDSRGRLHGIRLYERFQTASVVKVMMLVAYLQMLKATTVAWTPPTPLCCTR